MASQPPTYIAYLLRIWRAEEESEPIWRASLQQPGQEERQGFADLDELFTFLRSRTSDAVQHPTDGTLSTPAQQD